MKVKLKPLSARAKNRINEHGDTFILIEKRGEAICVESLKDTFSIWDSITDFKIKTTWLGWFNLGETKDVDIIEENL
jgi:hypothetical protein